MVSVFLLYSAYQGIFHPNDKTVYGVFCRLLADDKMVSYASQVILAIITASVLVYIDWYLLACAVIINMVAVMSIEYMRIKRDRAIKEGSSSSTDNKQG